MLGVTFLAPRHFAEDERLFIRSLADLCALALARYYGPSRTLPSRDPRPLPTAIGRFDRALGHVFASTLTLASVLTLGRVDREVADRLQNVIGELDAAIREIRHGALEMSARDTDEGPNAGDREPASSERCTPMGDADPRIPEHQRRLCRFDDGRVFAYRRGHDLVRAADHTLWAHESGQILLSAIGSTRSAAGRQGVLRRRYRRASTTSSRTRPAPPAQGTASGARSAGCGDDDHVVAVVTGSARTRHRR